jgi:hypothetical protein
MTGARQLEKTRRPAGLFVALALFLVAPAISCAAGREPVVIDPNTGLAISGIDPVAYFTDKKPVFGRPTIELKRDGAVWRFRNEGNRMAFAEHPEVYRPQFGGYDPVAILRDRSVAGNPLVWVIVGERLYLFYSDEARSDFLADSGSIIARAARKWPAVARTVGR